MFSDSSASSNVPTPNVMKSSGLEFSTAKAKPSFGGILPAARVYIRMKGLAIPFTIATLSWSVSFPLYPG